MNENLNNIYNETNEITFNKIKGSKISQDIAKPLKLIKTNRAECQHIKDDDNFNIEDFIVDDFFNNEKAINLRKKENIIHEKERNKIFSNFMQVVKWLKRESKNEEEIIKDKNDKKNLFNFIKSDEFNIDLLMVYLHKQNKIAIIDTLVELMFEKFINQSFFYLPQLCMFFNYKEYNSSLESYILDRCVNQIKFSLQITWLLNSFIEDDYTEIKLDVYESLLQKIEETLVNGQRNTIKFLNQYEEMKKDSIGENNSYNDNNHFLSSGNMKIDSTNSFVMKSYLVKECRLTYFDICIDFYSSLKYMCEDLKNYPKENDQRKNKLKLCIKDFNQKLLQQRIDNEDHLKDFPSFFGIILPFNDTASTEDIDSNLIVRIIPEECFCFSTKARVPTKICAECITLKDLQNSDLLNAKKNNKRTKIKLSLFGENNTRGRNKRTSLKRKTQSSGSINNKFFFGNNINSNEIKFDKFYKRRETIFSIKEEEEEDIQKQQQKERLKKFLAETSELENKIDNKLPKKNNTLLTDFEILPDISEELKNVFGKPLNILEEEIKQSSPYKDFKSYKLINFIAKADDDLRQEVLAMQLIKFFDKIFKKENSKLKLHPYEILITSSSSGLLEFLNNTSSIDGIKKKMVTESKSLYLFYKKYFKENFEDAQINFTCSLAAYSLICYYLKIKDRHNGNILIDMEGNLIHIDFGFILGISPGGINFENAPFKLTKEYVEIMGGVDSFYYQMYKDLMVQGMIISKKYVDDIVNIAEIMSKGSKMPCFYNKNTDDILKQFRERFYANKKDEDFIKIVDDMINYSYDNFRTNQYDNFQKLTNGIIP